ncbi:MAG: YjbF family lipoprotein [Betaproteobacteria bacterium]|jgi:hypothetical protein|nr:YjbF family lipoprotein [Betaproteobacteria bacterium]
MVRLLAATLLVVSVVAGCSTGSDAVLDTALSMRRTSPDTAKVNPNYRYLRVAVQGQVALLVLGYIEPHPQGPIEVWYSAEREVLKLQNGRLVGALGLTTEWRGVVLPVLPDWGDLVASSEPLHWTRTRDVMPGYRYGVEDRLTLKRIAPVDNSRLIGIDPASLTWFEETDTPSPGEEALPTVRYALDLRAIAEPVVYGEACLTKDLCFAWQRWPVAQTTAGAR